MVGMQWCLVVGMALGLILGSSTFLFCSFAISGVFGHNGMIERSLIIPGLIGL